VNFELLQAEFALRWTHVTGTIIHAGQHRVKGGTRQDSIRSQCAFWIVASALHVLHGKLAILQLFEMMLLHARIHWPMVHVRTVLVKITLETDMGVQHSGHGIKEQLGTVGHVAPTRHANLEQVVGIRSKVVQKRHAQAAGDIHARPIQT
jgi:hypothetical protein